MADEDETVAHVRIDYDSGERVYLQIVRIIRDMIISGELPVGRARHVPQIAREKRTKNGNHRIRAELSVCPGRAARWWRSRRRALILSPVSGKSG